MKAAVMEVVGTHFRPEFINRIDEVVVFHPLDKAEIRQIANIQLNSLRKRLAVRELNIEFTDAALDHIADAGFDPVYGARPLKRAIQSQVENPLAQEILAGKFLPGETIKVDEKEGLLVFDETVGR
jgi:ATP-dependent Clp protease ATP-binding subunit ClpB